LDSPWIRPRSLFSKIFNGVFFGWTLRMYRPNLKSVALYVPDIIVIEMLGGLQEEAVWGRGTRMVPFEGALVCSYRPSGSIVTFPPSLCVSEILPLLCSSTSLFPTPPLSPKFTHVHLEIGGWPFGHEERRCWANCPCD